MHASAVARQLFDFIVLACRLTRLAHAPRILASKIVRYTSSVVEQLLVPVEPRKVAHGADDSIRP